MFETAELGRKITDKEYKRSVAPLRQALLKLQDDLRAARRSQMIVVFEGVDGAGKRETVNLLNAWMDPRWLVMRAFEPPTEDERQHPAYWRYWRSLPARGRIGLFLSAWYSQPLLDRVYDRCGQREFDERLDRILAFETALADDGAAIVKFWMHLSRTAQEVRLKNLQHDPLRQARVTDKDWQNLERYDLFIKAAEQVISRTNTGKTPWTIVEGVDANYRSLTVGTILRDTLRRFVEQTESHPAGAERRASGKQKRVRDKKAPKSPAARADSTAGRRLPTVLSHIDCTKSLSKEHYARELKRLQADLYLLHLEARKQKVATVLVFEGVDAAGKGGAIRRITSALEARNYQVHGVAEPTDEELAQHYLWRFWRHVPRDGHVAIFDRSWYGRVLVERVEGFASRQEWRRAYAEINDFEKQLIEHGSVLVKFWIHVTNDEQLRRFKARETTPYKRWKLTRDDWRNRDHWHEYETAVNDIVQYTSTQAAPWTLVAGNDKRFARIKILETLCERLSRRLLPRQSCSES